MHLWIRHESLYRYDVPVRLGPHRLRLSPRPEGVRIESQRVMIEPEPVERSDELDAFGNPTTRLVFAGATQLLRVDSEVELETFPPDAPQPSLASLPWQPRASDPLSVYRSSDGDASVRDFAHAMLSEAGPEPIGFLNHLCETLYRRIDRHVRPSGSARSAGETLAMRSGACRDITVLFMEVARSLALPSRFVSGYQASAQTPDGQRHLHAWAEVFVPGAGWRGWDATHGLRVTDGHVSLCTAPTQEGTMPIEGGFFFDGPTVNSTLDHSVRIRTE
jgi:transglutaminase-like putative cysteine protease